MPTERLQKILAAAGVSSRRGSEALIAAGRVTVGGRIATIGESADPALVTIAVDGRPITVLGPASAVHLVLHKPAGVTSTVRDSHAERTVVDLVPRSMLPEAGRLYPVGRLDLDSEGLLLLTSDGPWADRVLHPRFGVEREYAIGVREPLTEAQGRALEYGIDLEEGRAELFHLRTATTPETARLVGLIRPAPPPLTWYRATLRQGRKRQLRRMFGAVDAPIERLVRVRIGPIRLERLESGDVRPLSAAEVRALGAGHRPGDAPSSSAGPAPSPGPAPSAGPPPVRSRRPVS
ncbi:MAG: pseudouridine synthase [Candidatus Limnocylindrales bacterium]